MKILIIGGGMLSFYLINTLLSKDNSITIIESDKNICQKIANEFNIKVINGDGTDLDTLTLAEASKKDMIITLDSKDEINLISCQLAKGKFGVKRALSAVNNPDNIQVFEKLGIDVSISIPLIIADVINKEI